MTPEQFQNRWQSLPIPAEIGQFEASEFTVDSGVWIARDHRDRQHLLVRVTDDLKLEISNTHGLDVSVARHQVPGQPDATYVDIVGLDQATAPTFAAVAVDVAEITAASDIGLRAGQVISALNKWKWFWGVDSMQFSAADALGLFGELWFLVRWLSVSPESIRAWEASNGARHDFQRPEHSIEVKTTSRAGVPIHNIGNLEQLDDAETGQLYLYSLRVSRDALAANTLNSLVGVASARLADEPLARAELHAKLSQRGYSPANQDQSTVRYRIVDEGLYRVDNDFPRLTRRSFPDGLPSGLTEISYKLDMTACTRWRVANRPTDWPLA